MTIENLKEVSSETDAGMGDEVKNVPKAAVPVDDPMSRGQRVGIVTYSLAATLISVVSALMLYVRPESQPSVGRSLTLAALLGACLGAVHSLASLSVHAGRKRLGASWIIFYVCRPFTGAGMALVTALVLVSGIGGFTVDATIATGELAVLAWSALAGLYSQPALDKLKELFQTLFGRTVDRAGKQ